MKVVRRKRRLGDPSWPLPGAGAVLLQLLVVRRGGASNWGQIAGDRVQNFALPYEQTAAQSLFSPRYAMASIAFNSSATSDSGGELFVLGGDDGGAFLNEIWWTSGVVWEMYTSGSKPLAKSKMDWEEVNAGRMPPAGVTYEHWIQCQEYFGGALRSSDDCDDASVAPGSYKADNMWSPRRHHQAVYFNDKMWVLGGRSREMRNLKRTRAVGGILGNRVEADPFNSNWREASVLRNDVWFSEDFGVSWELGSAGCRDPQRSLLRRGNSRDGYYGTAEAACSSDDDCYGAALCHSSLGKGTCVCPLWSPREAHGAVAYGEYMYVLGGFASEKRSLCGAYACGESVDADSGYRAYMNDIWYTSDGVSWAKVPGKTPWSGRGDYAIAMLDHRLYVLGGVAGGPLSLGLGGQRQFVYLSDVWFADLPETSENVSLSWENSTVAWPGRGGHSVVVEPAAALNSFEDRMYLIGGRNEAGILSDTWSWDLQASSSWVKDYTADMAYRSSVAETSGFALGNPPQQYFMDGDSSVELLLKYYLPTNAPYELGNKEVEKREIMTPEQIDMLHSVGIFTVSDLASADKYTILKLRGFDVPQVALADRLSYAHVCDVRELAVAFLKKCTTDPDIDDFSGEESQPWNVQPIFKNGRPLSQYAQWYGVDYTLPVTSSLLDDDAIIAAWDGCSSIPIENPNVPGIGEVTQVDSIRDPWRELNELTCKINPGNGTNGVATYLNQKLLLIGGRTSESDLSHDGWYRDDRTPTAFFSRTPSSGTSATKFGFTCDEEMCMYQFRLYDLDENLEVVAWTDKFSSASVKYLDRWSGGPGSGTYIAYVRAIDPAGNSDFTYREGLNMFTWEYANPLPWGLLLGGTTGLLVVLFCLYVEHRRRKKSRAMKRYAMKRMRRKFKQQQKKDAKDKDWRALYEPGATDGKSGKKKKAKDKKGKKRGKKKKKKKRKSSKRSKSKSKESRAKSRERSKRRADKRKKRRRKRSKKRKSRSRKAKRKKKKSSRAKSRERSKRRAEKRKKRRRKRSKKRKSRSKSKERKSKKKKKKKKSSRDKSKKKKKKKKSS